MFTRSLSALACLMVAGAVLAEVSTSGAAPAARVLGKATDVKGLITVSDQWGVSRVVLNTPIVEHSRFVTSSSGSAILRMDDGCDIELRPSQAVTVDHANSCAMLWASIESLGNPSALLLANGVSAGSLAPFAAGAAVAILLMGHHGSAGSSGSTLGGGGNIPGPGGSTPGDGDAPGGSTGNPPGGGNSIPTPPPPISPQ